MFQAGTRSSAFFCGLFRKLTLGLWVKSWILTFHNKRGRAELSRGVYYAGQRGSKF